jgi:CDP-paratose 2-epimerase
MRILITGGAGFVGSRLALDFLAADPTCAITALDNLRRRGSELNLPEFKDRGIRFVHGDIRCAADLEDLDGTFDVLIEASAEPSVHAGVTGSPRYVLDTNLGGTINALEFARRRAGAFVFLSSSRVYSIRALRNIRLAETATRFEIEPAQDQSGVSPSGISEAFSTSTARSFYGASKLASELMVQEYVETAGLRAVVNRCGVIAGPGQFGKTDQGVFTLWVANHYFGRSLAYTGFGGGGKQVRDLVHPSDLFELVRTQVEAIDRVSGSVFNVGGGRAVSVSLLELTGLCREVTGRSVPMGSQTETSPVDIPLYVSDSGRAESELGWRPARDVRRIVSDIFDWLRTDQERLRPIFG